MKLLVTDYDNTLEVHYDFTDNAAIFKRNMAALKKFMEKNIVCIATGRHFAAISKTLKENNIKFDYLCANNGAELYDCNYELLFCIPIDKKDLAVLMKLKEQVYFRNPFKSEKISSANIYINNLKKFKKMKQLLNNNLKESFVEYKYPKIKIINKKCNKLNAIYIIQNLEKINEAKIYTIGDDTNDVEMIMRYNGYSLTTACEETKRVALKVYEEFNQLIAEIDN